MYVDRLYILFRAMRSDFELIYLNRPITDALVFTFIFLNENERLLIS